MPTTALQQLNVRLDANVKQSAESVISLAGSSATEVIRELYTKIAGGAADYAEVMAVLCPGEGEDANDDSVVREGWSIADEFYSSIGYDVSAVPVEERPWDEVYANAMAEHFREKGVMQ